MEVDPATEKKLARIFGNKLLVGLTKVSQHLGMSRETLAGFVETGALRAVVKGSHIQVTRPMLVEFLAKGGSLARDTPAQEDRRLMRRASEIVKERNRKRRRRQSATATGG